MARAGGPATRSSPLPGPVASAPLRPPPPPNSAPPPWLAPALSLPQELRRGQLALSSVGEDAGRGAVGGDRPPTPASAGWPPLVSCGARKAKPLWEDSSPTPGPQGTWRAAVWGWSGECVLSVHRPAREALSRSPWRCSVESHTHCSAGSAHRRARTIRYGVAPALENRHIYKREGE